MTIITKYSEIQNKIPFNLDFYPLQM